MTEPKTIEYHVADFVEQVLPRATLRDIDAEALVDAIADEMLDGPRGDLLALVDRIGAPAEDCLCTVLSARATLNAAARGRAFYQHELRGRIPMPPHLEPEVAVWDQGTIPVWQEGVFLEPKYFSFRQDAPFAAFNPVHRRKWRPHELLHGAVGFFWRPGATRFETYVGARLNELVPVVHWYGLDEIFRPRCKRHRGEVLLGEWCRDCEASVRPYWEVEPVGRAAAIQFVRWAQEHFVREMEACRAEIATGEAHPTPLGRLNASSDAIGYLRGHWRRMQGWSFSTWAELFLREGFDYVSDLEAYADRVEACAARLVGGAAVTTLERFEALRQRRTLQDVGYRALLAIEWLDPDSAVSRAIDKTVMGALERCAAAVHDLVDSDDALWEANDALEGLVEVLRDVRDAMPDEVSEPLLAFGLDFWSEGRDPEFELANLATGISQAVPHTAELVDAGHVETFVESPFFSRPGRLASRFAAYLEDRAENRRARYGPVADLAAIEAWSAEDPHRDEAAEDFAHELVSLDNVRASRIRLNRTVRRADFGSLAVGEIVDADFEAERVELIAAYWRGELHIVAVDDEVDAVLAAVAAGQLPDDEDTLFALADAGIVVWLPFSTPEPTQTIE